jgi:hypothetical protein
LYNYNSKYGNVKGEMAASFVKDVLAREANIAVDAQVASLSETLVSLFQHFFPDKVFLGPQPTADGNLTFPVRVGVDSIHDLDELSSGEKEVLYGYLRMRNSAPRYSIILLDEPELHLNPRLIKGLPQFYRDHLSLALNNQMWLVSHSDALLREVVGKDGYNVFHMLPCTAKDAASGQLRQLKPGAELEIALVDMVGDIAAFRPGGKAIIFEGGGASDFDQRMTAALFPELIGAANLISGSNKVRVRALLETLDRAEKNGDFPTRFFAIADKDLEEDGGEKGLVNQFFWDVYHIENYLLEPKFIGEIFSSITGGAIPTDEAILDDLRNAAREVQPKILRHSLMDFANRSLVGSVDVGADPAAEDIALSVFGAVSRTNERLRKTVDSQLTLESLKSKYEQLESEYNASFGDGSWKAKLPGRDILKRYVSSAKLPVKYEVFRNLVLSRMSDTGYQPAGMKLVIDKIINA